MRGNLMAAAHFFIDLAMEKLGFFQKNLLKIKKCCKFAY